jgi:HEAT repeat
MNTNGNTNPVTGEVDDTRAARRRLKALVTVHVLAAAAWLMLPFVLAWVPPYIDLLGRLLVEHAIAMRAAMVCLPVGLVCGISARGLWGRRPWARRLLIGLDAAVAVLAALSLVGGIAVPVLMFMGAIGRHMAPEGAVFIFAVDGGLNVLVLPFGIVSLVGWRFLRRAQVRAAFAEYRPFQYTLSGFSLVLLLSAGYWGALWMATTWQRAVREIEGMGGRVSFSGRRTDVSFVNRRGFDDAALQRAAGPLSRLPRLKSLSLRSIAITDAGLSCLKEFPQLVELDLSDTKVTDAGLPYVAVLPNLQSLTLCWTAVTDEGLKQLKVMATLQHLNVLFTSVTRAGAADLVGAIPGLKIDRELGVADLAATNRLEALDKLTRGDAKTAVPLLVGALKDPDMEVRGFAVNRLIYFSSAAEPAVPALIEALAERLEADPPEAVPGSPRFAYVEYVTITGHASISVAAARALGLLGPKAIAAVPALQEMLRDSRPDVRAAAKQALHAIKPGDTSK